MDWTLAQIQAESGGNPTATSPTGAVGLLQLMPMTAKEMGVKDSLDPDQNIWGGMKYLKIQYDHFPEIPGEVDRLMFAYASYNCGRGYVNTALQLAGADRITEHWRWSVLSWYLCHHKCTVGNGRPVYRDVWKYTCNIDRYAGNVYSGLAGAPFIPSPEPEDV